MATLTVRYNDGSGFVWEFGQGEENPILPDDLFMKIENTLGYGRVEYLDPAKVER